MTYTPAVSIIIATHNRRDALLQTLGRVADCGLGGCGYETLVVDNDSTDGTADIVAADFPDVQLIRLKTNRGPVAKNLGIAQSTGKFILFLDDDSYPLPGSVERMIRHFQLNPRLGAASFNVSLADGHCECSAYPDVFIGCGVGLRRTALDEVGALPDDFFMQGEEYDLSLRLLDAGWDVRGFDDLRVVHLKSPIARSSVQKVKLDVRNNLLLALRRFPDAWRGPFLHEWMTRYWAHACVDGRRLCAARGFLAGVKQHLLTRIVQPVSDATFERFARIEETRQRLCDARRRFGLRSVMLVDWGKNLFPYRLACESAGIQIVGIADPRLAGQTYRGLRVMTDAQAAAEEFDAAIVSNLSPFHAGNRLAEWRKLTPLPVIDLFETDRLTDRQIAAA